MKDKWEDRPIRKLMIETIEERRKERNGQSTKANFELRKLYVQDKKVAPPKKEE